jgi:hypothetical protein
MLRRCSKLRPEQTAKSLRICSGGLAAAGEHAHEGALDVLAAGANQVRTALDHQEARNAATASR